MVVRLGLEALERTDWVVQRRDNVGEGLACLGGELREKIVEQWPRDGKEGVIDFGVWRGAGGRGTRGQDSSGGSMWPS